MKRRLRGAILALMVPALLFGGWYCLYRVRGAEVAFVASPVDVLGKAWDIRGDLAGNALRSLVRLMIGVGAGTTLGVLSGVAIGRSGALRTYVSPTLNVLMAIPIVVFLPFFLMVFGFGEAFRISVVAALVFLLVHQAMFSVVRGFQLEWLELAAHREKSEVEIATQMLLPGGLPELVRAVRLSLLFGWLAVALAEKAVAEWPKGGLGYQLLRAKEQGRYEELFASAIALGLIAWIVDSMVGYVYDLIVHWRRTPEGL